MLDVSTSASADYLLNIILFKPWLLFLWRATLATIQTSQ